MDGGCRLSGIVLDCADPEALAGFYQRLLGWPREPAGEGWAALAAPGGWTLAFQAVPAYAPPVWPWQPGAPGQMLHLDWRVDDLDEAVAFALACGATLAGTQYFTTARTLLDPAGHPLCLDNGRPEAPQHG